MVEKKYEDSFTIGSAPTGGAIKVYLEDIHSQEAVDKIDKAIELWKKSRIVSGKAK